MNSEIEDNDKEDTDAAFYKNKSYWDGSGPRWFIFRAKDVLVSRFARNPLLVVRIRKDLRQDHRVFSNSNELQTINWGHQTYDVEHNAIIRDRGNSVMYIIQGCRKPVDPIAWAIACQTLATEINDKMVAELGPGELSKYGKIELDARTAWIKMNNRDAMELTNSSQDNYARNTFYVACAAAVFGAVLIAQSFGYLPSKTGVQMDYIIQTVGDLIVAYDIHLGR